MNVDNEINRHEPYDINDISSIRIDLDFEESISHLPECIICRLTEIEGWDEDLEENHYCPCKFYYHDSCYEEWIQYKKYNKCLICETDISSNYLISPPTSPRRERFIITRRERLLLRRLQIRDRRPGCDDVFCNILLCKMPVNRRNSCITWVLLNEDCLQKCTGVSIAGAFIIGIIVLIYFVAVAPWLLGPL